MRKLATVVIVLAVLVGFGSTAYGSRHTTRVRYVARPGSPTNIDRVVIKAACIGDRRNAKHLDLRSYADNRAVFSCAHSGY